MESRVTGTNELTRRQTMETHRDSTNRKQAIEPRDFFSTAKEKIKLNWFLFEYALECQSFIRRDKKLCSRLKRKGIDDQAINSFCTHYSKLMRKQILKRISGKTSMVRVGYEGIESYFPRLGDELVDCLLTRVAEAWDSQTGACVSCPTRCISEKDEYAPMFDDPFYTE